MSAIAWDTDRFHSAIVEKLDALKQLGQRGRAGSHDVCSPVGNGAISVEQNRDVFLVGVRGRVFNELF